MAWVAVATLVAEDWRLLNLLRVAMSKRVGNFKKPPPKQSKGGGAAEDDDGLDFLGASDAQGTVEAAVELDAAADEAEPCALLVKLLTAGGDGGGRLQRELPPKPWRKAPATSRRDFDALWAPLRSPWEVGAAMRDRLARHQAVAAADRHQLASVVDDDLQGGAVS